VADEWEGGKLRPLDNGWIRYTRQIRQGDRLKQATPRD
jgi:hypothetical protein